MRIGFFADEYLPRLDGVITSMINARQGLEALGHEVYMIVPAYPGAQADPNIIRVPSTPVPLSDNVRSMIPNRRIRKRIQQLDLDIIHSHTPFASAQLARRTALDFGLPHVATFHTLLPVLLDYYPLRTRTYFPAVAAAIADVIYSADLSRYRVPPADKNSRFKRQAWKWTGAFIDSVDHVISPSKHFARQLADLGASTPITAVPNSLELSDFPRRRYQAHSPLRLVAVGRLSPEKRQYELVQAVARLDSDDYQLTIIGDGPDRRRVESLISALGLDNISLTGTLPPAKVKRYLYKSDIGILASSGFDNQPMTILEYLASGLPVVYCDDQLSEGLSSSNSLLSRPDPASLARAIKGLATRDLPRMSQAGQRAAKDFSIEAHAQSLMRVYQTAAGG